MGAIRVSQLDEPIPIVLEDTGKGSVSSTGNSSTDDGKRTSRYPIRNRQKKQVFTYDQKGMPILKFYSPTK